MAMWLFTEAMLEGRPIKVFNRGDMQRDFTYVDDIVGGVESALFERDLGQYEILNLGNHRPEELMRLVDVIAGVLQVEPKVEFLPMQPGDVQATHADITLARQKLGFAPVTPMEVGVPRFVRWYTQYRASTES